MKAEKIVINYPGGAYTMNSRHEAAQKVKRLLADHVFVTVENVSLKIQQADEDLKKRGLK